MFPARQPPRETIVGQSAQIGRHTFRGNGRVVALDLLYQPDKVAHCVRLMTAAALTTSEIEIIVCSDM